MKSSEDKERYFDLLPKVLFNLQWIEEGLKYYVVRAEIAIASHVEKLFPYRPTVLGRLPKMTLGQLVEYFAAHNGNEDLIKRLRQIVEHRNHVAHSGYLLYPDPEKGETDVSLRLARLTEVQTESSALVPLIVGEVRLLSARLGASIHGLPIPESVEPLDLCSDEDEEGG